MSFNKIPLIGNEHSDETRNIINLMVQVINNRGIEILSESGFLTWLDENGVKHQGEWDESKEYDRLSVVLYEGNSYTSVKSVPVGIDILNEEFWVVTGNYDAQVDGYRQNVRDLEHKVSVYNDEVKNIYVDSNVLTNGNGSEEQPFNHPQKAFDYLNSLSEIVTDGKWKINLKGNFVGGSRVRSLPKFRYPLYITGEVDDSGDPLTTIEMGGSGNNIGIWFEPSEVNNIFIENIHFKDFKIDFNGYGVLLKDGGNLFIDNCKASHCDIGFASVNQGRIQVVHSVIHDCFRGIMSQYNGTFTVGSQTNVEYNKNIIYNCEYGVEATRNSVGHVDNNEIYGCTYAAIKNDMASRTNVLGNNIHDNKVGVLNQGASEWINNNNTFTNNTVDFEHKGVSRETRLHSQSATVLFSYPPFVPSKTSYESSGSSESELLFTLGSENKISKEQYRGAGKRIKIELVGIINNTVGAVGEISITGRGENSNGAIFSKNLGVMTFDESVINRGFIFEIDINNTGLLDKNRITKRLITQENPIIQIGKLRDELEGDIIPRVNLKTDKPGVVLDVFYIQLSIAG